MMRPFVAFPTVALLHIHDPPAPHSDRPRRLGGPERGRGPAMQCPGPS